MILEVGDLKSEEDYDYGVWRSFSGERGVEEKGVGVCASSPLPENQSRFFT